MESSLPLLLLLVVAFVSAAQLPSSLKICKQSDPDFNGCLRKALMDAEPILRGGMPNLGLPPLDPLRITKISIEDTPDRPVSLTLEFNDVDIIGISNGIVDKVEMKPGSYHLKAKIHSDSPFSLIAQYKGHGKVLVLPVHGEGNINVTAARLDGELEILGQPIERDGEVYWDITDFKVNVIFGKLSIDMTGLFNNDKALAENTLKFVNENSMEIAAELQPALDEALSASFKGMATRVFGNIPYNSIFPK